jgi:hypothetical protein
MEASHLTFGGGQVNQARDAGYELARFDRLCQVHLVTGEQRAYAVRAMAGTRLRPRRL